MRVELIVSEYTPPGHDIKRERRFVHRRKKQKNIRFFAGVEIWPQRRVEWALFSVSADLLRDGDAGWLLLLG